jgi:hypothetical protein
MFGLLHLSEPQSSREIFIFVWYEYETKFLKKKQFLETMCKENNK